MKKGRERGKFYFSVLVVIAFLIGGIAGIFAYSSAPYTDSVAPSQFGHSVDETDWSQKIKGNVSADGFCIGTNCIKSWAEAGGNGGSSQWTTSGSNIYYSGGNVGIGVANPAEELHIQQTSGNVALRLGNFGDGQDWQLIRSVGNDFFSGDFGIQKVGTSAPQLIIGGNGNVGIGTIAPTANLDVNGTINVTGVSPRLCVNNVCFGGGTTAVYLEPVACGNRFTASTTCGTVACGGGYVSCANSCSPPQAAPRLCSTTFVGYLLKSA